MKQRFYVLLFAFFSSFLSAQNFSVDVMYYIPPPVDSIDNELGFVHSRFVSGISVKEIGRMQELAGRRVFAQLASRQKVYNYWWWQIHVECDNNTWISSFANPGKSDFHQKEPVRKIIAERGSEEYNRFVLKKGIAESPNISIMPDFRFRLLLDTTWSQNKKGIDTMVVTPYFLEPENSAVLFVENWSFDYNAGRFNKKINQLGFMRQNEIDNGGFSYRDVLIIDNGDTSGVKISDVLLKRNVVYDVAINYAEITMICDTQRKMDPYDVISNLRAIEGNIPDAERSAFLSSILSYAFANPRQICAIKNGGEIDSLHPFRNKENFLDLFVTLTTELVEDPGKPGTFYSVLLRSEPSLSNIYGFRFYEDWYYDPVSMSITKKVKGIGFLMLEHVGQRGECVIRDKGFYLKLN